MKRIFELLNRKEPKVGDFGIEIEAEGHNMKRVDNKWWGTHDDGSLRGSFPDERAEFVLNEPVPKKSVKAVLKVLAKELEEAKFDFSFRTSVHVHMNVQELEYVKMLNIIYTYLLLEEPLLNYCGRTRKGNRFCLRVQDAEGILDILHVMFANGERGFAGINENAVRYASINVGALIKYGSLEFRSMRGTMDVDVLSTWVDALNNIKTFAVNQESPFTIYQTFMDIGPEAFFKKALGKVHSEFNYARCIREMERSYSLSMDLPYAYKAYDENAKKLTYKIPVVPHDVLFAPRAKVALDVVRQVRNEAENRLARNGRIPIEYKVWFEDNDPDYLDQLAERGIAV